MAKRLQQTILAIAALAALALGGSALAGAATSNSATTGATAGATTTQTEAGGTTADTTGTADMPAPGSAAHEADEATVTGDAATKAKAAAVASVGSGTAGAITSNHDKTGYEVTVTKSDGTTVDVHLDQSFKAEAGHGHGPDGDNDGARG